MAQQTPLIDELKEMSGLDELHQCFKFLFIQEHTEEEAFLRYLGEKCDELQREINKRTERMVEVMFLNEAVEEAVGDIYECLNKKQVRARKRMAVLMAMLVEVRASLTKGEENMSLMDRFD